MAHLCDLTAVMQLRPATRQPPAPRRLALSLAGEAPSGPPTTVIPVSLTDPLKGTCSSSSGSPSSLSAGGGDARAWLVAESDSTLSIEQQCCGLLPSLSGGRVEDEHKALGPRNRAEQQRNQSLPRRLPGCT